MTYSSISDFATDYYELDDGSSPDDTRTGLELHPVIPFPSWDLDHELRMTVPYRLGNGRSLSLGATVTNTGQPPGGQSPPTDEDTTTVPPDEPGTAERRQARRGTAPRSGVVRAQLIRRVHEIDPLTCQEWAVR